MKILWVKTDFLHPTDRGGQIRTLEMLKCLHKRHELHYVAFSDEKNPEGPKRSGEYASFVHSVPHSVPPRRSLRFAGQLIGGLMSSLPVSVSRYASSGMRQKIQSILAAQQFDSLVCDFLFPAPNIPDLRRAVLFQHNVESVIWRRHTDEAENALKKAYFKRQADLMESFERAVCRRAGAVVAVSEKDRATMRESFGIEDITAVRTGVDIDYFAPPAAVEPKHDLIFVGSMDWLPNIDGVGYFIREILPLIHHERPDCKVVIAGRRPAPSVEAHAREDDRITVTGTVPDVRPYLWDSSVCIVPLRIGGGTRLKIFEAMAAKLPVVSTSIGAEGLPVTDGEHVSIADSPLRFARSCLDLLADTEMRQQLAQRAWNMVAGEASWDAVTRDFEAALERGPRPN